MVRISSRHSAAFVTLLVLELLLLDIASHVLGQ
jgi:hypothetical protein